MNLAERITAARGDQPVDLLLTDLQLVNVLTGEIYPTEIAIHDSIIVGVGEAWAGAYLDPYTEGAMSQAFPYVLMLIVLIIRPQGLFGWKIIERV